MKAQFPCLFQLFPKLMRIDQLGKRHLNGAADERKRSASLRELLPNELEHQQLVKIGIEQRPCNRVQFPVMVMRSPREVDDHNATTLPHSERSSGRSPVRRGVVPPAASTAPTMAEPRRRRATTEYGWYSCRRNIQSSDSACRRLRSMNLGQSGCSCKIIGDSTVPITAVIPGKTLR